MAQSIKNGISSFQLFDDSSTRERVILWENYLDSLNFGGSVVPHGEKEFRAWMSFREFGNFSLLSYEQSSATFHKREADSPAGSGRSYALGILHSGDAMVEQYGRRTTASPGDVGFVSLDAPFSIVNRPYRVSALIFNEETVSRWLPDPLSASGIVLPRSTPWGSALSATLSALTSTPPSESSILLDAVVEQANCLLALASGQDKTSVGTYHERVYRRLLRIIRQNAAHPDFSPEGCAERGGISLRSLHMIFASHDTSFCRELKRFRLEMARHYLDDGRFARKTAAEIADLCGFTNASHFTTCFGKRYGVSPAKYRKIRLS
jgi:AraC-like DNA-binding protein